MLIKSMIPLMMWLTAACGLAQSAAPPSSPPPPDEPAQTQPGGETVIPEDLPPGVPHPEIPAEVNSLLDRLENSAPDLNSFTAQVQYEKQDVLLGRKELRSGDLIYHQDPQTKEKSFAILFDSTIIDRVRRSEPKHHIFNGRWLAEVDHKNKQFIKREIVPPGKQLDPLKLGEGPFPLPIGQPKAEVLARFDVTAAPKPDEGLLKDLQNVEGLSLKPKPGTQEAQDYSKVDLYYDRETLLPVGIRTEETNGDIKTVKLLNVKRNPELTPEQLARLDIAEPDPREWRIDVRPWTPNGE